MVSTVRANEGPIGDQEWSGIDHSVRAIFSKRLSFTDREEPYTKLTIQKLREELYGGDQRQFDSFIKKAELRQIVVDLCEWDHGEHATRARHNISALSPHLRGGALELLYDHAPAIQRDSHAQKKLLPAVDGLVDASRDELDAYRSGDATRMDAYGAGFAFSKVASLFHPERTRQFHLVFEKRFRRFSKMYPVFRLYLPSLFAWAADSIVVSPADLNYFQLWLAKPDTVDWLYGAWHALTYYFLPRDGWRLMQLTPAEGVSVLASNPTLRRRLRERLVGEAYQKSTEGHANDGWHSATCEKMLTGLRLVGDPFVARGDTSKGYIPEPLARKLHAVVMRAAQRFEDADFDLGRSGDDWLNKVRGIQVRLQKAFGFLERIKQEQRWN